MNVSIIIVNYNTTTLLKDCIASVIKHTKKVSYEIIVSDNGSTDGVDAVQQENVTIVRNGENVGFGKANNAAVKHAKGQILLFLNPDTILLNDAVSILVSFLSSHPEAGACGGNLFNVDKEPTHSFHRISPSILREMDYAFGRLYSKLFFGKNAEFNHNTTPMLVKCVTGADLMVRRDVFEAVGGFDERFFMYYEDADLCARIRQKGYALYSVPEAKIMHLEGASFNVSEARERLILQGRKLYFNIHHSRTYNYIADRLNLLTLFFAKITYRALKPSLSYKYTLRLKLYRELSQKLYINGRFLTQPVTGVNRYAYDQCRKLKQEGKSFVIVCPRGKFSKDYDVSGFEIKRFGFGSSHFWAQLILPWFFLFKRNTSLVCYMGLAPLLVRHTVLTIHDLSFLHNPSWFSKGYYLFYRFLTPICARHAERIITVSHASKDDILQKYPFLASKNIDIIRPNINEKFFFPAEIERKNFLLTVASHDPRKNIRTLIRAISKTPSIHIKVVGGSNRVFADADLPVLPNVELLGRVSETELRNLYRTAAGFVFPSLFEGFGSPPVEAMLCGCSVAVSDIPVMHETCGLVNNRDVHVLYFNPIDEKDILEKVQQLLSLKHNY